MASPGIGRGLAAILPDASGEDVGELRELPTDLIKPNPNQPRKRFDSESLSGLASSIEASGVVQPLLVRPLPDGSYELIAGERRWRAAQQAGLEKVPAIVRESERAERLQVALIENVVREDLNPIDEARACAALVDDLGLSKEELAKRIGRSRPAVSNLIRLLELPDDALPCSSPASSPRATAGRCSESAATTPAAALRAMRRRAAGRFGRPRTGSSWPASQTAGQDAGGGRSRGGRRRCVRSATSSSRRSDTRSGSGLEGRRSSSRSTSRISLRRSSWPDVSAARRG